MEEILKKVKEKEKTPEQKSAVRELLDKRIREEKEKEERELRESLIKFIPDCKKCSGKMKRVKSLEDMETPFGTLELHECELCHEREYL